MIKFFTAVIASCALISAAFGDALDHWTPVSQNTNSYYFKVIYANGQFAAISDIPYYGYPGSGGGWVSSSRDGIHWVHDYTAVTPSDLAFGNGIFATCYLDPSSGGSVGYTYSAIDAAFAGITDAHPYSREFFPGLFSMAYGSNSVAKGLFVSVGHTYEYDAQLHTIDRDVIITSSDGTNWTYQDSKITNEYLTDITFADNFFFAVGYTNYNYFPPGGAQFSSLLQSSDGTNWTYIRTNSTHIGPRSGSIDYVNGLFYVRTSNPGNVYVGRGLGYALTNEPYPSLWVPLGSPSGTYVSVHFGSNIYTSTNGFTWTLRNTGLTNQLNCIGYGNGRFVMGCADGTLLVSDSTAPSLASRMAPNGSIQLTATSGLVSQCTIQASSDLKNWSNLVTLTNLQVSNQFLDAVNTNLAAHYYRTISQ